MTIHHRLVLGLDSGGGVELVLIGGRDRYRDDANVLYLFGEQDLCKGGGSFFLYNFCCES